MTGIPLGHRRNLLLQFDPQGCGECPCMGEHARTDHRDVGSVHACREHARTDPQGCGECPLAPGAPEDPAFRPSMDIAGICSCNSGIPSIHGHRRNLLLQFRHSVHPWTSNAEGAPDPDAPSRYTPCGNYFLSVAFGAGLATFGAAAFIAAPGFIAAPALSASAGFSDAFSMSSSSTSKISVAFGPIWPGPFSP